jgi:programmed cell death protein 5
MDELEQIRQRKLQQVQAQQLNSQFQDQMQQEAMLQQQFENIEAVVKQHMTREAVSRYGNIKAAFPEKAVQSLVVMARAIETRQVTQIDDNLLKHFLGALTPKKHEFQMRKV